MYFHKDVFDELVTVESTVSESTVLTYVLNDQEWMMMAMNGISTG